MRPISLRCFGEMVYSAGGDEFECHGGCEEGCENCTANLESEVACWAGDVERVLGQCWYDSRTGERIGQKRLRREVMRIRDGILGGKAESDGAKSAWFEKYFKFSESAEEPK